jgi:choloylglycine hydrolase
VVVAPVPIAEFGGPPPFHLIVHDLAGRCVVIEFVEGKTKVFENPVGVITNSPTFDWHLTNLRNYVKLTPTNAPPLAIGKAKFGPLGEGSGMLGLPGDYTPPSRFVRAVALSQAANPPRDADDAVNTAFHLLDNFDIVKGVVRAEQSGRIANDHTQWTSAADLKNHRYFYRTYDDPRIRVVDLSKIDFSRGKIQRLPILDKRPTFADETSRLSK